MHTVWNGRGHNAVLSALAAVGDQGMTLFGLGVAVGLRGPDLQILLDRLVLSGHVGCLADPAMAGVGQMIPRYRLTRRSLFFVPAQRRAV